MLWAGGHPSLTVGKGGGSGALKESCSSLHLDSVPCVTLPGVAWHKSTSPAPKLPYKQLRGHQNLEARWEAEFRP